VAERDTMDLLAEFFSVLNDEVTQSPEQWEQWWLHVTRRAIAASYLTHHGRPGPRNTLARRRRVLGEDHPKTRQSVQNLAADLRALGEA
jgi:hypothetical protein